LIREINIFDLILRFAIFKENILVQKLSQFGFRRCSYMS